VKAHGTKRFKTLKWVIDYAPVRWIFTGTPSSETLHDLWTQIYLLDKGKRLFSYITHFRFRWFHLDRSGFKYLPNSKAKEEILNRIKDLCLWIKTPKREANVVDINVELGKFKSGYDKFAKDRFIEFFESVKGKSTSVAAVNAAVLTSKLQQYTSGFLYDEKRNGVFLHAKKVLALEQLIRSLDGSALIYCAFIEEYEMIRRRFPNDAVFYNSSTPKEEKENILTRWNRGEIKILVTHPKTAGTGLNLQKGGHNVIWYSLTWSAADYAQANARLNRQGQERKVNIYHLLCAGSIDGVILSALRKKKKMLSAMYEYGNDISI